MGEVIWLSPPAMMALLTQQGEGIAYLEQLGVDLAPDLTPDERRRALLAIGDGAFPPGDADADRFRSLARTVRIAEFRVTLVVDLGVRRSLVAFVGAQGVAALALSGGSIAGGVLAPSVLRDIMGEILIEASGAGAPWSLARWAGASREAVVLKSNGTVQVGGSSRGLTQSVMSAADLQAVVAAVLDG